MIELKNVSAGYGKKEILHNISIQFERSGIISVIGLNGCGKSTLTQCCAGLIKPFSGEIIIDGKNISDFKKKELARTVSYLPQINAVSKISVRSLVMHGRFPYLGYPRYYSDEDRKIAEEAIKAAGISDIADKTLTELSGGQRQKAHIAMRLAQDTEYIFLDEPVTYIDIKYQFELAELMLKLKKSGKTIITVLHDINMALTYSDKTAVMDNGRIAMADSPENIVRSGIIEKVFGVRLLRGETGQYFFQKVN